MSCIVFVPTSIPINIFDTWSYSWAYKYPEVCGIGLSILTNTNLSETKLRTTLTSNISNPISISSSWKKLFSNIATTWTSRKGLTIKKRERVDKPLADHANGNPGTSHERMAPIDMHQLLGKDQERRNQLIATTHLTSPHALIKRQTS
jgi:hypothetical protein